MEEYIYGKFKEKWGCTRCNICTSFIKAPAYCPNCFMELTSCRVRKVYLKTKWFLPNTFIGYDYGYN